MTNRERARSLLMGFSQVFWPKYEGPRAADAPKLLEDAIAAALAQAESDALERAAVVVAGKAVELRSQEYRTEHGKGVAMLLAARLDDIAPLIRALKPAGGT